MEWHPCAVCVGHYSQHIVGLRLKKPVAYKSNQQVAWCSDIIMPPASWPLVGIRPIRLFVSLRPTIVIGRAGSGLTLFSAIVCNWVCVPRMCKQLKKQQVAPAHCCSSLQSEDRLPVPPHGSHKAMAGHASVECQDLLSYPIAKYWNRVAQSLLWRPK